MTLSDDTIMKYYLHVEFSPFPILVMEEYTRRFKKKTKNEMINDLKHQEGLVRTKLRVLKKAANDGKLVDDITREKSDEIIQQAKKKGFEISENIFKKSETLGSKLKARTKSTIKKGIKTGQNLQNSNKKYLELLEQLGKLKKAGIITDKEFQEKKKKILSKI